MECNGMFPKDGQIQSYHPKILNSKVIMIAQMNFQQCTLGYSLLCTVPDKFKELQSEETDTRQTIAVCYKSATCFG